VKETPQERCARILAKHSKTLPCIFGDPLRQGIGTPDSRLANESPWHIALYTFGYLQELTARVKQMCEDPRETPERKREACQLLVNIATEAAADIHLLFQWFPKPFRAIAEARSNFPCLFPAHPEQRAALGHTLLEDLGLGKLHPLKLRSNTGRKTFSMEGYANKLLLHYLKEIRRIREELLSFRLDDPWISAATPRLEIERLDEEIPLSVANVKPWMNMIWKLLLEDFSRPETHRKLRSFGSRSSRRQRASGDSSPGVTKKGKQIRKLKSGPSKKTRQDSYIRSAIKEALEKYLVRMLRKEERTGSDK
jgi:hypothetical protein